LLSGVQATRRRGLAAAGLWVMMSGACSPEPERRGAQQAARAEAAGAAMVPAATREVKLPAAHLSEPAAERPAAAGDPQVEAPPAGDPEPGDPRAVPEGTPVAIARVFQRLPVAIHDGPPLGGIGASGIHVDKIWLGTRYEKDGCADETASFSLARHSQVNVCFRAVHSRVEESVEVEWVKEGAPFRRRGVQIPDLHAYRSRAFLVLRREYLGAWQARVLSNDGVVLATIDFTVTE
jgi:hypothetical protein